MTETELYIPKSTVPIMLYGQMKHILQIAEFLIKIITVTVLVKTHIYVNHADFKYERVRGGIRYR